MTDQPQPNFNIEMPPAIVPGSFADFANVWHTNNAFVLDFVAITQPPMAAPDAQGQPGVNIAGQVVSRVRIPPQQVFELARALTQQLTAWEQEHGISVQPPQGA